MGCDIHWAIERRHPDDAWETVASKTRVYELGDTDYAGQLPYDHPWKQIGQRNYGLFGILSDVRYEVPNQAAPLARFGLPEDASPYTALNFDYEENPDYHSQGVFTLGELRRAAASDPCGCAPHPEDREILAGFAALVETILEGPAAMPLDTILFGPEYGDEGTHPAMRAESNHARLVREARARELVPVSDDTLRFVVCYDN